MVNYSYFDMVTFCITRKEHVLSCYNRNDLLELENGMACAMLVL